MWLARQIWLLILMLVNWPTPLVALQTAPLARPAAPKTLAFIRGSAHQRKGEPTVGTDRTTDIDAPPTGAPAGIADYQEDRGECDYRCDDYD